MAKKAAQSRPVLKGTPKQIKRKILAQIAKELDEKPRTSGVMLHDKDTHTKHLKW